MHVHAITRSDASFPGDAPAAQQPVQIRTIDPGDAEVFGRFIGQLSPMSRLRRFHATMRDLPPQLLARFMRPDPVREQALVALTHEAGRTVCVAEARYSVSEDLPEDGREFALAVADGWQRQGLGRRLLCRLIRAAERQGVGILYGDVLRDNLPMLALARRLGFVLLRHPGDMRLLRVARTISGSVQRAPA